MATGANGATVPAGSDVFDPVTTINGLNNSLHCRATIPASNATARNALTSTCGWTPTTADPLLVLQTDTGWLLRYDGTRWHFISDIEIGNNVVTTNPTLGTSMGTIATVTATTLGGPLRVQGAAFFNNGNSGSDKRAAVQLTLDTVAQTPAFSDIDVRLISGQNSLAAFAFIWELTGVAAGSHTIALQALASLTSSVTVPAASLVVIEKP